MADANPKLCECGCGEVTSIRNGKPQRYVSGHNSRYQNPRQTHGHSKRSPTYICWQNMRRRCSDPKTDAWPRYGGRGIKVCDRWQSFENFLSDMGVKPKGKTLERINNNSDYEPGNCKWATVKQQSNNRSTTRVLTAFGQSQTIPDWSAKTGIPAKLIRQRLSYGWASERAVSTPVGEKLIALHCKNGHRLDESNTYTYKGIRSCRQCRKNADIRRKLKIKCRRESERPASAL